MHDEYMHPGAQLARRGAMFGIGIVLATIAILAVFL